MKLPFLWLLSVASVRCYKVQLQGVEQDLGQSVPRLPYASVGFHQGQIVDTSQLDNIPHMDLPFRQARHGGARLNLAGFLLL